MGFTRGTVQGGNICLIWIDDMIDVFTWRDTFGLTIRTPNIDRLMAAGTRFANAYATVPLCAPCRAELATGLSPFRTGLVDLNRFWRDVYPPTGAWQYDLRRAGFRTFQTGKVDANYRPSPPEYGRILFNDEPGAMDDSRRTGVIDYLEKGPGIRGINGPDDDGSQDNVFYDNMVASNAIAHLAGVDPARRHLFQLGFKHPHYNLDCPDRFYRMYDPAAIRWPEIAAPEDYFGPQPGMAVYEAAYIANGSWTPEKAGDEAWRQVVRAYFAAITHVDHEIGRWLDALQASPIGQNTTVILLSDNGFNLGNHDSFHKMSQWDSAAHVPLGIWHAGMEPKVIELPVSLHNIPKTVMDLAGLPPRPGWTSGQSLLPLIDASFGTFDRSRSPVTSVFGTLSVRPSVEGMTHLRYFRYPNGEEHVYDVIADPGETRNLVAEDPDVPLGPLRQELVRGAADLGLDLRGLSDPSVKPMMAVDGTVVMEGAGGDFWAYGRDAEQVAPPEGGGRSMLWYMAGPDDYTLRVPAGIEKVRIATVVARNEADVSEAKVVRIVAHPDSPIEFETSERVTVEVTGSRGDDVFIGAKYASSTFHGGAGDDEFVAISPRSSARHFFYGGAGDDTLRGGNGRDILDGGTGDDLIFGGSQGSNLILAGPGNDTIRDGNGNSVIHTGPGRNIVTSAGGDDTIHVGAGENDITCGPGHVTFHVSYGGITRLHDWRRSYTLDLSTWPEAPSLVRRGGGVRITLGLSVIEVMGIDDIAALAACLRLPETEPPRKSS